MTLLSQQLVKLTLPRDQVKGGAIQHSSLIFSTRVAADYDVQDIYDIGINGFQELAALNPAFERFKDTLFHPTSAKFERLLKSEEFLAGVDEEVELFLAYLSNYGVLSPAHKALEWLVRAYKIHIYNGEALLAAFLPLHDSKIFSKLLEITTLPADWAWLETAKSNNVGVGRSELVRLCTSNPHYLAFFMVRTMRVITLTENTAKSHHSFLVSLVFLVLEGFQEVPPEVVPKLYSCVTTAVLSADKDLKSAGYILIGQIVRKIRLRDQIVGDLIQLVSDHPHPALVKELILCVSCILYNHPDAPIPSSLLQLVLKDEFYLALTIINQRSDIGALIKGLMTAATELCFTSDLASLGHISRIFQIPDVAEPVLESVVGRYFEQYFSATQQVRDLDSVVQLGDLLANTFSDQVQDTFQAYHDQGCELEVLGQLKELILGKYLGNEASQEMLEISHDLSGIRMLGLLKLCDKLNSGDQLNPGEKSEICRSITSRIADPDDSVSLKSLEMIKQFMGDPAVVEQTMVGVLKKVEVMTSLRRVMTSLPGVMTSLRGLNQDTCVSLISTLAGFRDQERVVNVLLVALVNLLPLCDAERRKQIATKLKSNKDLKELSCSIIGETWLTDLVGFLRNHSARSQIMSLFSEMPTPYNCRILCLVATQEAELSEAEVRMFVKYFLKPLNTAIDRKFEYKEVKFSEDDIANKSIKLYKNFAVMKREWEFVGMILTVLTKLGPVVSSLDDIKAIITYLVRSCTLHPAHKPLLLALNKKLVYKVAAKVYLSEDPASVLSNEGLSATEETLSAFLGCLRAIKISEADMAVVSPYILTALVAPSKTVQSWAYKRLKTLSKMVSDDLYVKMIQQINISKNITLPELKQEIASACAEGPDVYEVWLCGTLSLGDDLPQLYPLLAGVQHPTKLAHSLAHPAPTGHILGDLTPQTGRLLRADPELLSALLSVIASHPGVVVERLGDGVLEGLGSVGAEKVVRGFLAACQETSDEVIQLAIKQKLSELSPALTMDVFLSFLSSDTESFNPHVLHLLNIQHCASLALASKLFETLPLRQGYEEDIVTLLTSVVVALGSSLSVTPANLKAVVDVIRHTDKQTNRHALHHSCIVLLSKIAGHHPKLVLEHVLPIFTFMGDTAMRRDDNYSIQVLMEAISTIIPVIKKKQEMGSILRVFCDTLPHIPSHRTDPVFHLLVQTAGTQYLYHVFVFVLDICSRERQLASQFSHFLQTLVVHFNLTDMLDASLGLINSLAKLPEKLGKMTGKTYRIKVSNGVELNFNDAKHYNYFKLGIATQLYLIANNKHFTGLLLDFDNSKTEGDEKKLAELIELSLSIMIHFQDSEGDKFVDMLNKRLSGVITNITGVLPSSLFISVVKALLTTDTNLLHEKSLHMLHNRIKADTLWTEDLEHSTIRLLDTLLKLAPTQTQTWQVLGLLARKCGTKHPAHFLKVLGAASSTLSLIPSPTVLLPSPTVLLPSPTVLLPSPTVLLPSPTVLLPSPTPVHPPPTDLVRCICTCIEVLGARCIGALPGLLTTAIQGGRVEVMVSVVRFLPQFTSPYLRDMLLSLAKSYVSRDLSLLTRELGQNVKIRVLLPALTTAVEPIIKHSHHDIRLLTDIIQICIDKNSIHDIKTHVAAITTLFVKLLDYRESIEESRFEHPVEDDIISSFLRLVYKLTEKEFLPLLAHLLHWSEGAVNRTITFYNLTTQLSEKLQGLFLIFGGSVFTDIVEKLDSCKTSDAFETKKIKLSAKPSVLVPYVLRTLYNMLKYDSTNSFLTPDKFESVLPALLDLVTQVDYELSSLSPALSQLPVSVNSERLQRVYNLQLLNLTKSHVAKVRSRVLTIYKEFIERLGQQYSSLLPDSLPFISELLEDSDEEVEKTARDIVRVIEEITGESMDQYL